MGSDVSFVFPLRLALGNQLLGSLATKGSPCKARPLCANSATLPTCNAFFPAIATESSCGAEQVQVIALKDIVYDPCMLWLACS